MTPWTIALAAALAGFSYLVFRDDDENVESCLDSNLSPEVRAEAIKLLEPETGGEALDDLIARTRHMRQAAKIAARAHPKLAACLTDRAADLEAVIRKTAAKAKIALPKSGETGKGRFVDTDPTPPPPPSKASAVKPQPPNPNPPKRVGKTATTVFGLPNDEGPAREDKILQLVAAGELRPFQWRPINCGRDGHTCTVWVSDDAMALGDADAYLRFSVTHPTADRVAQALGAFLPTTRISDLAWAQADTRLTPHPLGTTKMAKTERMFVHNNAIEKDRAGRGGLVRPVGKDWVTSNHYFGPQNKKDPKRTAVNFGWQAESAGVLAKLGLPDKYKSPGGVRVVQPLSTFHTTPHVDYSQTVTLVRDVAMVDGKPMHIAELMQHPTLSKLVSDEGPLKVVRHPSVPFEGVKPVRPPGELVA